MIAFFVEHFSKDDVGGVKSYLRSICSSLLADGKQVVILTQLSEKTPKREEVIDSIPVVRLDCGDLLDRLDSFSRIPEAEKASLAKEMFKANDIEETSLKLASELAKFISEEKPRAIHVHNSFFIFPYAIYFLKQIFNVSFMPLFYFWCHSPPKKLILPNGEKSDLYDTLSSFQNLFTIIFAISKSVHNSLLQAGVRSKVNYLGVNPTFFSRRDDRRHSILEKLGLPSYSFVILYTGRFLKSKGLDLLPAICKQLIQRDISHFKVKFLLVGEGKYREELEAIIEKEKLNDRFYFYKANSAEELVDIYSSANCFILPTRREAIGASLLEAMSCSLPCIACDLSGIREAIKHLQNGILVSIDNTADFVRWLAEVYSNQLFREKLGSEARKTILEQFNSERHFNYFVKRLLE